MCKVAPGPVLKWQHFANLIQIVKSKMYTSRFISIFLPTSLPLSPSLSLSPSEFLYRRLICCCLELIPVVAPKVSSHNSVILSDQTQPVWLFVWTKCGTMAWSYATCLHADVSDVGDFGGPFASLDGWVCLPGPYPIMSEILYSISGKVRRDAQFNFSPLPPHPRHPYLPHHLHFELPNAF